MVTATKTEARERPILFSGAMVRAILEGRKTQTRRVVNPQPEVRGTLAGHYGGAPAWYWKSPKLDAGYCHTGEEPMRRLMESRSPYGRPGDRLWVRETWALATGHSGDPGAVVRYAADRSTVSLRMPRPAGEVVKPNLSLGDRNRPGIHLPRWACRLVLEVTGVRVERLQAITDADAQAEGATFTDHGSTPGGPRNGWHMLPEEGRRGPDHCLGTARYAFGNLWNQIHGGPNWNLTGEASPWDLNPWVWVVSFRRLP